ncbi:anaerobic C4-dicarboxylate transporter family protein, partial [Escherichia coli]
MLFTIQLIIILICLFYGARKGGIALGLLGGIGPVSYTHLTLPTNS